MDALKQQELLKEHFSQFVSEHKREFIERVLSMRTRYITIVLEDIYQSQNTSAVIRTCECMGLQDVHVVEMQSTWSTNKLVLKGSDKWLSVVRHRKKGGQNTASCFELLRSKGYRIAVTDPAGSLPIEEVPLDKPVAFVMGNERHGSSPYALSHADLSVAIPMSGFTESMNISVSAAICLFTTMSRLRKSTSNWALTDQEKNALRLEWYKKAVRKADLIEREFLRSIA